MGYEGMIRDLVALRAQQSNETYKCCGCVYTTEKQFVTKLAH